MPASIADSYNIQLEQVSDILARYYDLSTSLASKLKISKTVAASRYLYRIPFMRWVGGTFQKYSANRGDMGSGTGPNFNSLTAGYFDSVFNFEITKEQKDYMKSNGSAMADVLQEILTNAFTQLEVYDNTFLFGDGTGKLTNSSSASPSTTQLTFAGTTDTLGVNRLWLGAAVDVWDSTGATKRANGPYYISNIDWNSKIVTFSVAPTAMVSGDLLAVYNVDAYGPAALTTFSSTWPGGGTSNAPGLTGDSWRHGLGYVNDATTANYYLGKLKSTYSELLPVQIPAASAALTFSTIELAKNLAIQKRDQSIMDGMQCVVHMAQRAQLQDTVTAVSVFQRNSTSANMIDLQPKADNEFQAAGVSFIVDKRQDKARVDSFNAKNWFRVEGHPSEWFDYGDGQKMKAVNSATTGNVVAAYEMKIVQKMDTGCMDPGAGFFISGLAVPSSY
ncbi:MAG: hypothetical protein EBR82_07270 [Caulobacteraceae bacterium]|nr:hypothetical protein [Caulobacteraceae bacterium]